MGVGNAQFTTSSTSDEPSSVVKRCISCGASVSGVRFIAVFRCVSTLLDVSFPKVVRVGYGFYWWMVCLRCPWEMDCVGRWFVVSAVEYVRFGLAL